MGTSMLGAEVVDPKTSLLTAVVATMLLVTTLGGNFLQRLNNEYWFSSDSILSIFLGFLAALPLCGLKQFGLFTADFDTIFFLFLIPPIIFESGYDLNHKDFFKNLIAIMTFAILGTFVSSLVMGSGLFMLAENGYIRGLNATSPKEALQFGSLMSATDPVATLAVLGSLNVEPQLYALVFGESVLNDAVAIVLFQTFEQMPEPLHVSSEGFMRFLGNFFGVAFGSVLIGLMWGTFAALLTKNALLNAHPHSEVTVILSCAWLSFISADAGGFSGLMAVFFCGIMMSHYAKYNISVEGRETTQNVTRVLAFLSETIVFLYFGVNVLPTIISSCDSDHRYVIDWPFVLWTLLACVVSRAINVIPLTLLLNACKTSPSAKKTRISMKNMLVIWFSGLRGAIAFALSLTFEGDNRKFIIPCVVLIILFTNVFLGQGTVPLLLFLGVRTGVMRDDEDTEDGGSHMLSYEQKHHDCATAVQNFTREKSHDAGSNSQKNLQKLQEEWREASINGTAPVTPPALLFRRGSQKVLAPKAKAAANRSVLHKLWRKVDERILKPLLGGRTREDLNSGLSQFLIDRSKAAEEYVAQLPPLRAATLPANAQPTHPPTVLREDVVGAGGSAEVPARTLPARSGEIEIVEEGGGGGAAGAGGGSTGGMRV